MAIDFSASAIAAHDYRPMLHLAEELQNFGGYLGPEKKKEATKLQEQFDQKRREFVYAVIREGGERSLIWPKVSADLDRLLASGEYYESAIHYVRAELETHIAKQLGSNPILRFVTRWALPVAGAIGVIVYGYLKYLQING